MTVATQRGFARLVEAAKGLGKFLVALDDATDPEKTHAQLPASPGAPSDAPSCPDVPSGYQCVRSGTPHTQCVVERKPHA